MATVQNSVTITDLTASSYNGKVTCNQNGFVIEGNINLNADKVLTGFGGHVQKDNETVCGFNSFLHVAGQLAYNLTDVRDTTIASLALVALGAAAKAIQTEVNKE